MKTHKLSSEDLAILCACICDFAETAIFKTNGLNDGQLLQVVDFFSQQFEQTDIATQYIESFREARKTLKQKYHGKNIQ